jgi:hypothetical protein
MRRCAETASSFAFAAPAASPLAASARAERVQHGREQRLLVAAQAFLCEPVMGDGLGVAAGREFIAHGCLQPFEAHRQVSEAARVFVQSRRRGRIARDGDAQAQDLQARPLRGVQRIRERGLASGRVDGQFRAQQFRACPLFVGGAFEQPGTDLQHLLRPCPRSRREQHVRFQQQGVDRAALVLALREQGSRALEHR